MVLSPPPVVAVALAFVLFLYLRWRNQAPLPPGPRKLPIVGNAFNMPKKKAWLAWMALRKCYGDIISFSFFGRHIIVLNSAKVAVELLEKRSSIYSDRPYLAMGGDLVGWSNALSLTPYSQQFRTRRKLMHQVLSPRPVQAHFPSIERNMTRLIIHTLETPRDFVNHIRNAATATVLSIAYGYFLKDSDNEDFVDGGHEALDHFSASTVPGAFLVDIIPVLKYVPAWMPGAGFRRLATQWRKSSYSTVEAAFSYAKDQVAKGTAAPSFVAEHLAQPLSEETEFLVKWTAFSIFGGGFDTTFAAVCTFFLAMAMHPEAQAAGQSEIDRVIGNRRMPTMADRPSLPYIEAIVKEVFRWGPPAPGGVPHRVMENDIYMGYRIPAGSTVVTNIWAMTHDEEVFPEPNKFLPERFLGGDVQPDPLSIIFGFGRRICPGQYFAVPSLFLAVTMTLATLNISKSRDADGEIIEPKAEWLSGTISHPAPFQCTITPRFVDTKSTVQSALDGSE